MNIILNTPLPTASVSKQEFDNKILFVFLIFMVILTALGLLFVDFSKELSKTTPLLSSPQASLTEF